MLHALVKSLIFFNRISNSLLPNLKVFKFITGFIFFLINFRIFFSQFICFFIKFLNFLFPFKFLLFLFRFLHFVSLFFLIYPVKFTFQVHLFSNLPFILILSPKNSFLQILIFPSYFYFINFIIRVFLCPLLQFKRYFVTFSFYPLNFSLQFIFFPFLFSQIFCHKFKFTFRIV